MDVTDLLDANRVMPRLAVTNKAELIAELAQQIANHVSVDATAAATAISARERLGSTGLGRGFADAGGAEGGRMGWSS